MTSIAPHPCDVDQGVDPDDLTHGVCACQYDSVPRLALCGTDCTDDVEAFTPNLCVVCSDVIKRREPCRICGGLD